MQSNTDAKPVNTADKKAPKEVVKNVGGPMPKPDWEAAREAVSTPDKKGIVYLPKEGAEYSGKFLLMTETHLVQQIGKNSAVAHDLGKLDNGKEFENKFDQKELIPNRTHLAVKYGQEKGVAEVITYDRQRAQSVEKEAAKWAENAITNPQSRETFMKHLKSFTQEMAKTKTTATPDRTKDQTPTKAPPIREQNR